MWRGVTVSFLVVTTGPIALFMSIRLVVTDLMQELTLSGTDNRSTYV